MQSHFNGNNWMNSDQFPKFTYTGTIDNFSKIKLSKDGVYTAKVNGNMTIKGITKKIKVAGKITVAEGKLQLLQILKLNYPILESADNLSLQEKYPLNLK